MISVQDQICGQPPEEPGTSLVRDGYDAPLLRLLKALRDRDYRFVTPTPASHARVIARPERARARSLADVLGWSLPFAPDILDAKMFELLDLADLLEQADDGLWRSRLRVSSLMGELYLHTSYPTEGHDSVFFGPDSYRFANLIEAELAQEPVSPNAHIVDIGTGSGVGAIVAAKLAGAGTVTGTDVNPQALCLAAVNAQAAGVNFHAVRGEGIGGIGRPIDLALANPPYIVDDDGRQYRHGGAMHGGEVSLDMARAAVERLAPNGRLVLYTGSAIVDGEDALRNALAELAHHAGCSLRYRELDPDVFGEELERTAYRDVDRIALVAATITRSGS